MSQMVAEFYAKITADTTQIQASLNALNDKLNKTEEKGKKTGGAFDTLKGHFGKAQAAAGLLAAAGAGVISFLISASNEAAEAARVHAKLESVLLSTGEAAGWNIDQLDAMASELERVNLIDGDLIKNAQAVMLTFTKIGQDTFPAALKAAMDMSAVLGGDLQGSVIQIGKAMNDFSGYTALKRAGVSFTAEQIKQIEHFKETNDLVGYQNLLLNELAVEFGGAAQAMAQADNGMARLNIAWGNFKEQSGDQAWYKDFLRGVAYTIESTANWIAKNKEAGETLNENTELWQTYAQSVGYSGKALDMAHPLAKRFIDQIERGRAMTEHYSYAIEKNTDVLTENAGALQLSEEEIEALTKANQDYLSTIGSLSGEIQNYREKEGDLIQKHSDLTAEKQNLITQGYHPEGQAIGEINAKLAENEEAQRKNADAAILAGRERILSMLEQQLAIDGLNEKETAYLLDKGLEWGIYSQEAVDAMKAAQEEVRALQNEFNGLPTEKTFMYNIQVSGHEQLSAPKGPLSGGYSKGTGGWMTIPPGYPNDSYPMMVESGEKVAVIPASQASGGGGTSSGGGFDMSMLNLLAERFADAVARSNRAMFEKSGRR